MYLAVTILLFPLVFRVADNQIFASDAASYSTAALHLLHAGTYSVDGVRPFVEREPGESVLLAITYALFGDENPVGVYVIQATLLFFASLFFCTAFVRSAGRRAAGITFLLILTSGSILHCVFSANREILALSFLLVLAGLYFSQAGRHPFLLAAAIGVCLGGLILTYYPFVFLPFFFAVLWLFDRRPTVGLSITFLVCAVIVGGWIGRNVAIGAGPRVIGDSRVAVMWYARAEQAEQVRGLTPLRCLIAEYVTRDWQGLPLACSTTALYHQGWPGGTALRDERLIAAESRQKLLRNFGGYLWFSLFEVVELHIPFVGGGFSSAFNDYTALTGAIMYVGVAFGLRSFVDRRYALLLLLIGYAILVFCLTDATPRYLVPVLFCYCAFAGIGFDRLLPSKRSP